MPLSPERPVPTPPIQAPPAPNLATIAKSYSHSTHFIADSEAQQHAVYPVLSSLSPYEISTDLDMITLHRHPLYEAQRPLNSMNGQANPISAPATLPEPFEPSSSAPNTNKIQAASGAHMAYISTQASTQPIVSAPAPAPASFQPHGGTAPPPAGGRVHGHNPQLTSQIQGGPSTMPPAHYGTPPYPHDPEFIHPGPGIPPPGAPFPSSSSGAGMYGSHHVLSSRRSPSPAAKNPPWLGSGLPVNNYAPSKGSDWPMENRRPDIEEERDRFPKDRKEREQVEPKQKDYHLPTSVPQHRHVQHTHSSSGGTGSHSHAVHHHHRHHHHIVHHHHSQGTSFAPPNGPTVSPRTSREYENGRLPSGHHGPEVIPLSSYTQSHWKGDEPPPDFRNDGRTKPHARSTSGVSPAFEERDRPAPIPFTLTASQALRSPPQTKSPPSPKGPWNHSVEDRYHLPAYENRPHSPRHGAPSSTHLGRPQGQHSRQESLGLSSPRARPIAAPRSPSSTTSGAGGYSNTSVGPVGVARSPTRYREPLPPRDRSRSPPGHKVYSRTTPPLKSLGAGFVTMPVGGGNTNGNVRGESPLVGLYGTKERVERD
jgi:hypothetical protein